MKIRERVRKGELSPEAALAGLKNPDISPEIVNWLKTTGKERYRLAISEKKAKQAKEDLESKKEQKKPKEKAASKKPAKVSK